MIRKFRGPVACIGQGFQFLSDSHVERRSEGQHQLIRERLPNQRVPKGEPGRQLPNFAQHAARDRALKYAQHVIRRVPSYGA